MGALAYIKYQYFNCGGLIGEYLMYRTSWSYFIKRQKLRLFLKSGDF